MPSGRDRRPGVDRRRSHTGPPGSVATHCSSRRRGRLHPFEAEAANLFFQLASSRYERASLFVTSKKPFGRSAEVFGDDVVATTMIDRLVHHAEVVALRGDSQRLRDRDPGRVPAAAASEDRLTMATRGQLAGGSVFGRRSQGGGPGIILIRAASYVGSGRGERPTCTFGAGAEFRRGRTRSHGAASRGVAILDP